MQVVIHIKQSNFYQELQNFLGILGLIFNLIGKIWFGGRILLVQVSKLKMVYLMQLSHVH